MVFRQFVTVFTSKAHPLVLFLDDLQWIDAASLALIEHLLTHPDTRYLLLIGAYRDNEVSAAHPLMTSLDDDPPQWRAGDRHPARAAVGRASEPVGGRHAACATRVLRAAHASDL